MSEKIQEPLKDSNKTVRRNKNGQILPGSVLNPNGHIKGKKNYETRRREAIESIAKKRGITPEEVELEIHLKGLEEARKGNYQFYKDDFDRTYGKALETHDVNINEDPVKTLLVEIIGEKQSIVKKEVNQKQEDYDRKGTNEKSKGQAMEIKQSVLD